MSNRVITATQVSKCYKQYARPIDRMIELFTGRERGRDFWALRGVTFEVDRGETVGIIGRNGSGKSTLLQILAGTLKPTQGAVQVNGRISALLELGTGFNPEFTGRENIYLNGQILGLSREEIEAKYDEIVAFSGIGEFVEMPVKTYSSGMYMRLGFAVAINVNPDVLIVDEALAVGDEAFQRKCYGRLTAFKENGGTILLVSHASSTIVELCDRALLLDSGERLLFGNPKLITAKYQKLIYAPPDRAAVLKAEIKALDSTPSAERPAPTAETLATGHTKRLIESEVYDPAMIPKSTINYESCGARIENVRIENSHGEKVNVLERGGEYSYCYEVHFDEAAFNVRFAGLIKSVTGIELGGLQSHLAGDGVEFIPAGTIASVRFKMKLNLLPNTYFTNAGVLAVSTGTETYLHRVIDVYMFRIVAEAQSRLYGFVDVSTENFCSIRCTEPKPNVANQITHEVNGH
jgi:lipopolysaccharide transport system ATP-binding protein